MTLDENGNVLPEEPTPQPAEPPATEPQENDPPTAGGGGNGEPTPEPTETKTFTQEMVDEIVRSRLERDRKATYKRYGVEDKEGLDTLIGKAQSYDVMKERYEGMKAEVSATREKMAFMSNNINPAREEDVRAYFKGKGIEFNETNLVNELATHPEWLNVVQESGVPQTKIEVMGSDPSTGQMPESDEERQKRVFGI